MSAISAMLVVRPALAQDLLLVGNKQDADLSVIEVATGKTLKRIPTGVGPHEVAVSPDRELAVVANYGAQPAGNSLSVIDTGTLDVVRTISLDTFTRPHGLVFLPDNRTVVVTSETSRAIVIVDVVAGAITGHVATDQQGTHMVTVNAEGTRAFTANIGSGTASEVDLTNQALVRTLEVAPQAEAIALSPDGRELWVGSNGAGTVTVFDVAKGEKVATLPAAGVPIRVYFSPDGKLALVSSARAQTVRFFDTAERAEKAAVKVSGTPIGAVFSPDGSRAFVALTGADAVAVIDLKSFAVVGTFATGTGPDGIAYLQR
ncbi:MAG: YVTN family beta-propeller repeat protein [Gemmatimonadota bacterium]